MSDVSLASVGLDPDALDRSVDPCDDFYQFACGGWIQRTLIPADKPGAMRGATEVGDRNAAWAHELLERAAHAPGADPAMQQLGVFYRSCMDEAAIDKAGIAPLRPVLAAIDRVKDARSLTAAIAALHALDIPAVFALGPALDAADARRVIARLDQAGLGLDRDDYLAPDQAARTAYLAFAEAALAALGHPAARSEAGDVLALETELARLALDRTAHRDPHTTYNKLTRAELAAAVPHLDWDTYWAGVGLPRLKALSVTSRPLLAGLDALIPVTRPETWRAYLAVQLIRWTADALPQPFEELGFQLRAARTGQPELPTRWKRCVAFTQQGLGDALGEAYVREHATGATGEVAAITGAVANAMIADLDTLDWIDDAARAQARAKLIALTYRLGAPRSPRPAALKLDVRAWASNALAVRRAARARQLAAIDRPRDATLLDDDALGADARYDPQRNAMAVPAGLLQPPFYSPEAAIPVNLGALGSAIGHELTHGFDDQGAQYDAAGNLADGWQPHTTVAFRQRAQCVVDQYNRYDLDGARVDGARTAGENIADIGGVKLAFAAYRALRGAAPKADLADGFTQDQQFFLGFGQMWCAKLRPDYERLVIASDPHAPIRWRVDGALAASPAFAAAFRCAPGAKMSPVQQCAVW